MNNEIFLDSASTTKPLPEVVEVVQKYLTDYWHNPSALYAPARKVREDIESARQTIANFINARPEQIIFTSGASESNSMFFNYDGVKITSEFEHASSFIDERMKCEQWNYDVFSLTPDADGFLDFNKDLVFIEKDLNYAMSNICGVFDDSTISVIMSIMMANNEIGTIQDVKKLRKDAFRYMCNNKPDNKKLNFEFHTDATQAFGHIPIDVEDLGIDYLSASAHKIGALKGTGILYVRDIDDKRKSKSLLRSMVKGHQEYGIRGGTENVIGIMAFAKAVEIANKTMSEKSERVGKIRDYMIDVLLSYGCQLNGSRKNRLYNNINVVLPNNIAGESMVHMLDTRRIYISSGSACNSKNIEPSATLVSIGRTEEEAMRSVRITLPDDITIRQAYKAVIEIKKMIDILGV